MALGIYASLTKSVAGVFLLHLAITNALFTVAMPFWIIETVNKKFWTLGKTVCKATSLVSLLNLNCSILFLIVVVLDRMIIAKFTLKVIKWRTIQRAHIISFSMWILAILLSFPAWQNRRVAPNNIIFFPNESDNYCSISNVLLATDIREDNRCVCRWNWKDPKKFLYFRLGQALVNLIVLVVGFFVCKSSLSRSGDLERLNEDSIKRDGNNAKSSMVSRQGSFSMKVVQNMNIRRRNASNTNKQVLLIIFAYTVCWLPRNILMVMQLLAPNVMRKSWFLAAMRSSIMMAYLHPVLIPITWFLSRPNGISDLFGDVSATVLRPRRKSEFDFARYSTIKKLDNTSSRGSSFYLHKAAGSCIKAKGDLELKPNQPSSPLLLTPKVQH